MRGPLRCDVFAGLVGVAAALGSGGCGDDTSTPGSDAATGGGFVITWSSDPVAWPGDLGDGVTVERATFALDNLRIVGDAAPGDPRTTVSSRQLVWDDTSQPEAFDFPNAPGGVYSQLSLLIDGHVAGASIDIRGRANVDGTDYEFRIIDDSPFAVTLEIDETLSPPAVTTLGLHIDFTDVLDALDISTFEMDSGRLELDNGDPQFATFRAKLMESFAVVN